MKKTIALFSSGAVFVLIALLVAPQFIWLAGLAGFATGYIGYEAREFFRAIPQAYQRSRILIAPALNWLKKPHPFLSSGIVLGTMASSALLYFLIKVAVSQEKSLNFDAKASLVVLHFLFCFMLSFIASCVVGGLAELGAHQKGGYFAVVGIGKGKEIPATYSNVFHCCAIGFAYLITTIVMFCLFKGWYYLAKGVWLAPRFVGHFLYHLFKLVHSKSRLICGLYGVLGGLVTWTFLVPEAANLTQSFFLIFCGGSISVVIGKVLGFEIMAKRILKVVPNGAPIV